MRRQNKNSAVFDVPEKYKSQMDKLVEECKEGTRHTLRGYEVLVVDSMDMLEEEDDRPKREEAEEVDERDLRDAMRNKRDW